MDAATWLAEFDRRGEVFRAEREEMHRVVGGKIRRELHPELVRAAGPVVLEAAHEVESDSCPVSACRRVYVAALGAGWAARITRALAAVPRTGLLETYAVRAARHDERLWACWWNGSFNAAQYWSPGGQVEILAATDADTRVKIAYAAAARATRIPLAIGPPKPVTMRGVLDAVDGIRLTRHVIEERAAA